MTTGARGALARAQPAAASRAGSADVRAASTDAWEAAVAADPTALVTQSPAWTALVCEFTRARSTARAYAFPDGRQLVLPLVRRAGVLERSMPQAWGYGGLVGGTPTADDVRAVLADLRTHPVASVRVRPNPLHAEAWAEAAGPDVLRIPRRAHLIDLADGYDWTVAFAKRARGHVRKAERSGLEVRVDTTGELVGDFHALFMRSVERWAGKQREPVWLARARARRRDPEEKIRRLVAGLSGRAKLWVAYLDGQPVASILVLQDRTAHYTRGAIDAELAGRTRASYLLHKLAIEDAAAAGCTSYHMGETGTSASLSQFKEAVGARSVEYAEYVVERVPLTRADRLARTAVKRLVGMHD